MCKALGKLEKDPAMISTLELSLSDNPFTDLYDFDTVVETMTDNQINYIKMVLKRPLTMRERNLIELEPRCMGWCVTTLL